MKKLFYFLFAVALWVGFVGCSKDADEQEQSEVSFDELIVGTWSTTKVYDEQSGTYKKSGVSALQFNADGTGVYSLDDEYGKDDFPSRWTIENSKLTIRVYANMDQFNENKGAWGRDVNEIAKLNKSELVLTYEYEDNNKTWENVWYLSRSK